MSDLALGICAARCTLETGPKRVDQSTRVGTVNNMNPGEAVNSSQRGAADTGIEGQRKGWEERQESVKFGSAGIT